MSFLEAVHHGFSHYAVFSGRASRSEYWYFQLFVIINSLALDLIEGAVVGSEPVVLKGGLTGLPDLSEKRY